MVHGRQQICRDSLTPRFGCTFLIPIVDFGGSTGTVEFRKSTLGAPVGASFSFDLVDSFLSG